MKKNPTVNLFQKIYHIRFGGEYFIVQLFGLGCIVYSGQQFIPIVQIFFDFNYSK